MERTVPDCLAAQLLCVARRGGTLSRLSYPAQIPIESLTMEATRDDDGCVAAPYSMQVLLIIPGACTRDTVRRLLPELGLHSRRVFPAKAHGHFQRRASNTCLFSSFASLAIRTTTSALECPS